MTGIIHLILDIRPGCRSMMGPRPPSKGACDLCLASSTDGEGPLWLENTVVLMFRDTMSHLNMACSEELSVRLQPCT